MHLGDQRYRYVGLSGDFRQRVYNHKASIKKPKTPIAKWCLKHGWDLVKFDILDRAETIEELRDLEVAWIAKLRAEGFELLNLTDGGEGLLNPSPEVRARMSAGRVGEKNHRHGKPMTDLQRKALALYNEARKTDGSSRGSRNGRAILNEQSVLNLRQDYSTGLYSQQQIAEKYGIAFSNVYFVTSGRTWKHVGGPLID